MIGFAIILSMVASQFLRSVIRQYITVIILKPLLFFLISQLSDSFIIHICYHMNKNSKRKQEFAVSFQESSANFSENDQNNEQQQNSQGRPIQLIKIRPTGKIQINPDALEIIASFDQPVGFVSLVGKMRTGKSCLMNRLLHLSGEGFKVDPSTSSCTEGIWMWSQPFFNQQFDNYIFFLDTEGTDSLVKDVENDTKIFTLAVLISSYFIYNSVGSIDQRSLSDIEMVTALSKQIKTEDQNQGKNSDDQLYRYMPKFMWLLRDFMLKIMDERGKQISSTQYLQNCLTDQTSIGKANQSSRKIKKSLMTYFPNRQCLTLVRPVDDQEELQHMNTLPDDRLRKQFRDGISMLRKKIMANTGPKTYDGKSITGYAFASMIQNYVNSFNDGKVPNIKSAWQQISDDQGALAYSKALDKYTALFQKDFSDEEPKGEQIYRILSEMKEETLKEFEIQSYQNKNEQYLKKLKAFIKQKQELIIQQNKNISQVRNIDLLKKYSQKLRNRIESNYYSSEKGREQLQGDIDEVSKNYNREAKGQKKGQLIAEFMSQLAPILAGIKNNDQDLKEKQRMFDIQKAENDRKNKMKEAELQSKRKQQQSLNSASKVKTGSMGKKLTTKESTDEKKKRDGGCCAGKCQIM